MHYFDINEIVNFTNYFILNNSEIDYNIKLSSVLAHVRGDEIYEIFAHDDKGYETTVKLLENLPNISNNISIYDIGSTIILLFDQTFYRQELYHDQKICDYLLDNIENNFTTVNEDSSESLLEIYNPDEWIQEINNLDKLYSMEELPAHFEYFIQNKTQEILKKKNELCDRDISFNIQLLQFYQYIIEVERAKFVITAAAYQVKYGCHQANETNILYDLQQSLILRVQKYISTVKKWMKIAPCEIRQCSLKKHKKSKYIKVDRNYRMSLVAAISDIDQNEIITNVAFASKKGTIYPRIQTSILSGKGYVRTKRRSFKYNWEKSTNIFSSLSDNLNYIHFGTNKSQRIALDDIHVDDGHVVTGIKFSIISNIDDEPNNVKDLGTMIRLEIRATKFDFETGKLGESKWISGKIPSARRSELSLNCSQNWISSNDIPDSVNGKFVRFQMSNSMKNGRKSTIPFFYKQTRPIIYTYPLTGIGLEFNCSPQSEGVLSFKLIFYNPSTYMNENISSENEEILNLRS
ncbi:hypothetical protein PV327_004486 [Microctonus hyperodae]|uniref:Uncharacterized protein n=1 Tax=Microctonus hyperodae TaxID=165561 RepID=A0AA39FCP1_MICHY|nr:hypothetical protein PV327_004486 [Microctonus hyperodae]